MSKSTREIFGVYKATLEEEQGVTFVHLDVYKWTPSTCKIIRDQLQALLDELYLKGQDNLFFYLPASESMKFHNLIRPVDKVMQSGWINVGVWYTGEEQWD